MCDPSPSFEKSSGMTLSQYYWGKKKTNQPKNQPNFERMCQFCKVRKSKAKSEMKSLELIIAVDQDENTGLKERYKILRENRESRRMAI